MLSLVLAALNVPGCTDDSVRQELNDLSGGGRLEAIIRAVMDDADAALRRSSATGDSSRDVVLTAGAALGDFLRETGNGWLTGGDLHWGSRDDWDRATDANRLATSGDWMVGLWRLDGFSDADLLAVLDNRNHWELSARELLICINERYADGAEQNPAELAVVCYAR